MDEDNQIPEGPGKTGRARVGGCVNKGPDNVGIE